MWFEPKRLSPQGLEILDHLPSRLPLRISDEVVDTGWIAKSTYLLVFS